MKIDPTRVKIVELDLKKKQQSDKLFKFVSLFQCRINGKFLENFKFSNIFFEMNLFFSF